MPGKKFNYYKFGIFCAVVLLILGGIIFGIVSLVKDINYKKTFEYKFINIGYTVDEEKILESELSKNQLEELLLKKFDSDIDDFVNEKYFLYKNLSKYLDYKKNNSSIDYRDIVSIINCEANVEWIDTSKDTDITKKEIMLVNRLYGLTNEFEPDDLVQIPVKYAYSGRMISGSILQNIVDLIMDGSNYGYTLVVSVGYRSYSEQEKTYNSYVNSYGQSEADTIVARPGHSEYQTGITFDLQPYNKVIEKPFESEEYKWLKENAHKYGFILRLPKDKEKITGFNASAWKLRYVGKEVAAKIYNESLTLEEYYAYYVIGEKNE